MTRVRPRLKAPRRLVDGEDGDAVVPAVGAVDELPGRGHDDLRAGTLATEVVGQRRDGLHDLQDPTISVIRKRRHRRVQLVDDVDVARAGMEGQMARPSAGAELGIRKIVRDELPGVRIQAIHHYAVYPEVTGQDVVTAGVLRDEVRVRSPLAVLTSVPALHAVQRPSPRPAVHHLAAAAPSRAR